jgi:hypothetical protein
MTSPISSEPPGKKPAKTPAKTPAKKLAATAPRRRSGAGRKVPDRTQRGAAIARSGTASRAAAPADQPRHRASMFPRILGAAVVVSLGIGWANRGDYGLSPVSGLGYWLGIAGGSLMLILALYPMRKRLRALSAIGPVAFWFNAHMVLGIVGPVLVLWHANFKLGSFNSSVALIVMLAVAGSGVIGRYLHSKVNSGLYVHKAEARNVTADADELRGFVGAEPQVAERMVAQLHAFAQSGTAVPNGLLAALVRLPLLAWRGAVLYNRLRSYAWRVIAIEGRRRGRSRKVQVAQLVGVTEFLTEHIAAAKRAATFAFYERLFRLWHVFHVPLYVLLIVTALLHVYASHYF